VLSLHTNLSLQDLQHILFEDPGALLVVTPEQAEARAGMMMRYRGFQREGLGSHLAFSQDQLHSEFDIEGSMIIL